MNQALQIALIIPAIVGVSIGAVLGLCGWIWGVFSIVECVIASDIKEADWSQVGRLFAAAIVSGLFGGAFVLLHHLTR